MKIKLDHYIAKIIAEQAKKTVLECIDKNLMSAEFEVNDIKGTVNVAKMDHLSLTPGSSNTYQYSVRLFNNIQLVTGAPVVKHTGCGINIQRAVMSAIGVLVMQETSPAVVSQRLAEVIRQTIATPNLEHEFVLFEELRIKLQYRECENEFSYFIDVETDERTIAKYYNYGKTQNSVNPYFTGVMNPLVSIASGFQPSKERKFYITEFTTFQNLSMLGGGCPTAMINPGQPLPHQYNPSIYGYAGINNPMTPNNFDLFNNRNGNDPFSHF
ncbi:hypothetical protein pETSU_263 [Edwardsiella phage pEt-SU]|uniref:Uncharacterized protein n=1 Tax=Edwardsiella phage pEt-SU TaxID=2562142 RepID=A0A4D6DX24_9CAUD|nr:hypothetical protein HOV39_gp259 [Edwardsiella phage pEt-SU]QBZ70844.1 hypothetical protein pETSU_263 [Edwardsiella phage pEt-SU]